MNYGGDDQIEAGSTELLRILAAVGYTPLFESANHLSQNMTLFTFVQSSLAKLPKLRPEQVENEGGVDPFWGVPHYAKVPYYRAGQRSIIFDRGRLDSAIGRLFQFIVPMFPEQGLDHARIAHYKNMITAGAVPTAVAISVLDVKGPAMGGVDHWCFAHYLIDGHHKIAATASAGSPLTIITFVASDRSVASRAEIEAALASLEIAA